MASIEVREGVARGGQPAPISYRVTWRNPDKPNRRGGYKTESSTYGNETHASKAKGLVEAHGGCITKAEVEATILKIPLEEPKPKSTTVEAWSRTWLESRTSLSDSGVGRYEQQLRDWLLPAIGHLPLDEVSGPDIAKLIHTLRGRVKEVTVTKYYACAHAMFEAAIREKKIDDNPCKRTDFKRQTFAADTPDEGEHVYLTPAEYQRIWDNLSPGARPLADFMIHTGMRFGEATATSPDQVDPTKRQVMVDKAWKKLRDGSWRIGLPKSGKKRPVPVGSGFLSTFGPLAESRKGQQLLLVTPENTRSKGGWPGGRRWMHSNFVDCYWDPAVAAAMRCEKHPPPLSEKKTSTRRSWPPAGMSTCDCPHRLKKRPTPHDLRHSFVAWQIAAGRPLASISRRLGHFSVTLTERVYAGLLPEVDEADGAVVDAALAAWRQG